MSSKCSQVPATPKVIQSSSTKRQLGLNGISDSLVDLLLETICLGGKEWPIEHSTQSDLAANPSACSNRELAPGLLQNDFSILWMVRAHQLEIIIEPFQITRAIVDLSGYFGGQMLFCTGSPWHGMSSALVLTFGGWLLQLLQPVHDFALYSTQSFSSRASKRVSRALRRTLFGLKYSLEARWVALQLQKLEYKFKSKI